MDKVSKPDKTELLKRLDPIKLEDQDDSGDSVLGEMSLARSLLKLAEIDPEHEYHLCRTTAERLLEKVPEPEELDFESDEGEF